MSRVVGVKFRSYGQVYYFTTGDHDVARGDQVVVKTEQGLGLGKVILVRDELPKSARDKVSLPGAELEQQPAVSEGSGDESSVGPDPSENGSSAESKKPEDQRAAAAEVAAPEISEKPAEEASEGTQAGEVATDSASEPAPQAPSGDSSESPNGEAAADHEGDDGLPVAEGLPADEGRGSASDGDGESSAEPEAENLPKPGETAKAELEQPREGHAAEDNGSDQDSEENENDDEIKPIIRLANEEDLSSLASNDVLAKEAFTFCRERIKGRKLDMKLVDVEVFFDRSKIIFYFTAPTRIDFRELVKDLVKNYRTRIELRQIGVRHETQMIGAVGNCGMVCCCRRYLRKFAPVTIKMAKEQNLFLNPTKISGICGRLLCCLSYEQENYENFHRECPKIGKKYLTDDGACKVVRANLFRKTLSVFFDGGEEREITLEDWLELHPKRPDQAELQAMQRQQREAPQRSEKPARGRQPRRKQPEGEGGKADDQASAAAPERGGKPRRDRDDRRESGREEKREPQEARREEKGEDRREQRRDERKPRRDSRQDSRPAAKDTKPDPAPRPIFFGVDDEDDSDGEGPVTWEREAASSDFRQDDRRKPKRGRSGRSGDSEPREEKNIFLGGASAEESDNKSEEEGGERRKSRRGSRGGRRSRKPEGQQSGESRKEGSRSGGREQKDRDPAEKKERKESRSNRDSRGEGRPRRKRRKRPPKGKED